MVFLLNLSLLLVHFDKHRPVGCLNAQTRRLSTETNLIRVRLSQKPNTSHLDMQHRHINRAVPGINEGLKTTLVDL
jgi:hypothetical protein